MMILSLMSAFEMDRRYRSRVASNIVVRTQSGWRDLHVALAMLGGGLGGLALGGDSRNGDLTGNAE